MKAARITSGVRTIDAGSTIVDPIRTRNYRGPFWGQITGAKEVSVHDGYFVIGDTEDNLDTDPETVDTTAGSYASETVYIYVQVKYKGTGTLSYSFEHSDARPSMVDECGNRHDNLVFEELIGTCEADARGNLSEWRQKQYGDIKIDKYTEQFSAKIAGASENQITINTGRVYWGVSQTDLADTLTVPTAGSPDGNGWVYIKLLYSGGAITASLEINDEADAGMDSFGPTATSDTVFKIIGSYTADISTGEVLSWRQMQYGNYDATLWNWYDPTTNDTDARMGLSSPEMVLKGTTENIDADTQNLIEFKGGIYISSS